MKRMIHWIASILILAAPFYTGSPSAPSVQNVCGTINSNTTWIAANSPYEVCMTGVAVETGFSLTIQPGVIVQFQSGGQMSVRGTLLAKGTPGQGITFTGVTATPGSWAGVFADHVGAPPASVTLDYATFLYGGLATSTSGQLVADGAMITVTNSLFDNGVSNGIYTSPNTISYIKDTQFTSQGGAAVKMIQPVHEFHMENLSANADAINGVFLGGTNYFHGVRSLPNPGIPYVVDGLVGDMAGDSLSLTPGSEMQFTANGYLNILGDFNAIGQPTAPITLTGQTKTPGSWNGLILNGGQTPATAELEYVTLEYGGRAGSGANVTIDGGKLTARFSKIRNSQKDGVRIGSLAYATVLNSQITGNALYGVRNTGPTHWMLATNNWWGDLNGPTSDTAACSSGHGDKVTSGILFRPVLTSTDVTHPFPLSDAPILSMTPRRWFAPADGTARIYFDILLKDANGAPLAGRTVRLTTSLGQATDGGITDIDGKTLAYVLSATPGDADVIGALDTSSGCEGALSPTARVTFTPPINITDLFPNSPAPYFDGNINVSPLPLIQGVPANIQVKLTNPLTQSITVDASLGFVQSSIGLAFGSIKDFNGQIIPANSSVMLTTNWTPLVSGHYCLQVTYSIRAVGPNGTASSQAPLATNRKQRNITVSQGGLGSQNEKPTLQNTQKALDAMNFFIDKALDTDPFSIPLTLLQYQIAMEMSFAQDIANALVGDPPSQDYKSISIPPRLVIVPSTPPNDETPMEAQALNDLANALAEVIYPGQGATMSIDRGGGASQANDLNWASIQANAAIYYKQQMGAALATAADKLDTFYNLLISEGKPDSVLTADQVKAYQADLRANGFSQAEIDKFHTAGFSDAQIEALRQQLLAADPNQVAGSQQAKLQSISASFRALSDVILHPHVFGPPVVIGGSAGMPTLATSNSLAQVYQSQTTILVGNPGSAPATIDLRLRPIDLPPDWNAYVIPSQVVLGPGEQISVSVQTIAGSPTPQGSQPSLAVEGYDGSTLLGGVVVEVSVPRFVLFNGKLQVYLPLVQR